MKGNFTKGVGWGAGKIFSEKAKESKNKTNMQNHNYLNRFGKIGGKIIY